MLIIRFQRTGRENFASYRLVLAEKARPAKGKVQEVLGTYLPKRSPHILEFREDRIHHWIAKGAQLSDSAARLLTRAGVGGIEKFVLRYTKRRPKAEMKAEAETAPAAAAPAAEAKAGAKKEAPKAEEKKE